MINVARQAQIFDVAKHLWIIEGKIKDAFSFEVGAKWSDENPQWFKYPDELPKENKSYEVILKKNGQLTYVFDTYNTEFGWTGYETSKYAVAWKEVTKPPKFLDEV